MDKKRIKIVSKLLENKDANWRVLFGANEAAFEVRYVDPQVFYQSVHVFHDHWNCKIRGLCAENLFSVILNSGNTRRKDLLDQFCKVIQYWLSKEDDCWVLDHVFRLFHTLHKRGVDATSLFPSESEMSPLLAGAPNWYQLERDEFLRHIEGVKETLQHANGARPTG
jgi:hypothetical protein